MSSKISDKLKYMFTYSDKIHISKIYHLPYFDNFEHIEISNSVIRLPKRVKRIYCFIFASGKRHFVPSSVTHLKLVAHNNATLDNIPFSVTNLIYDSYFNNPIKTGYIPTSVTHLTFGFFFNQKNKKCIPPSVTHLTFGYHFNQSIENSIPPSVTHLTFGCHFDHPINDYIPTSVTHLTFGDRFNQQIKNCIPSSVTHLTFGDQFDQPIRDIPHSVVEITLSKEYENQISLDVQSRVKILWD